MRIVHVFSLFKAKKQGCGVGKFLAALAPGLFFAAAPASGFF